MAKRTAVKLKDIGEWGVIDWIQKNMPSSASGLIKGIGDDAAILIGGEIITTDMLIENVHFRREWQDMRRLGCKALAVNLSDIAAMGGFARCAFLNIAAPPQTLWEDIEALLSGFSQTARDNGVAVAGGDTCASPKLLTISVTVVGNTTRPVLRSGARPGDLVYVTGTLGDAALALKLLTKSKGKSPVGGQNFSIIMKRLTNPKPRMQEGRTFGQFASSMIDISDGLAPDLGHICRESSVGVRLDLEKIPISDAYKFVKGRIKEKGEKVFYDEVLYGGEDYELLFTVPAGLQENINRFATKLSFTQIGEITPASEGMVLADAKKEVIIDPEKGYKHF